MLKNKEYFIADSAKLVGEIEIESNVNIWFNVVIRADSGKITIGENTNIQDNAVLHSTFKHPICIGNNISIGHNATLNGGQIGNNTLIGINSTILDNTIIGNKCGDSDECKNLFSTKILIISIFRPLFYHTFITQITNVLQHQQSRHQPYWFGRATEILLVMYLEAFLKQRPINSIS